MITYLMINNQIKQSVNYGESEQHKTSRKRAKKLWVYVNVSVLH